MIIRPKSALGLKYVEITRGRSDQGFEDGDTIPLAASRPTPVEFDEFTSMFNDDTRTAIAGEPPGASGTRSRAAARASTPRSGCCPRCCSDIQPVAKNLASPRTHLRRFFNELGDAARIVAPVAESQASLFVNLDTTFTALDEVAKPFIQDSITEGVPALDQAIKSFPHQRPFLRNSELLFHELRPGASALRVGGARPRRHVRERHGHPQALAGLQPPPRLAAAGAAALRQRPGGAAAASSGWPRRSRRSTRRCSTSRPPSCRATTSPCGSATCRRC